MVNVATYEKVFQLFTLKDKSDERDVFKHPVCYNGKYLATDTHSMIFMPAEKAKLNFVETIIKWGDIIPKEENCNTAIKVADIDRQLIPEMIDEYVTEETESKCRDCDGEGELECDLGHQHDCNTCDGEGTIVQTIKTATGKKIADINKIFRMNDVTYAFGQLRRLIDACKLMEVETITQIFKMTNKANLFRCGDTCILIASVLVDPYIPENVTEIKI